MLKGNSNCEVEAESWWRCVFLTKIIDAKNGRNWWVDKLLQYSNMPKRFSVLGHSEEIGHFLRYFESLFKLLQHWQRISVAIPEPYFYCHTVNDLKTSVVSNITQTTTLLPQNYFAHSQLRWRLSYICSFFQDKLKSLSSFFPKAFAVQWFFKMSSSGKT